MYNRQLLDKCLDVDFEKILKSKGYSYFTNGMYNLNIVGVRSKDSKESVNVFNDALILTYNAEDGKHIEVFPITTDPGLYYLKNNLSTKGCAILKEGQIRGGWQIGLHQGKYKALVQKKPVTVYRDSNKDSKLDFVNEETGIFGINIHKSGDSSVQVDKWSAGCQVFARVKDFNKFMNLVQKANNKYGNSFTYTLINETDLK